MKRRLLGIVASSLFAIGSAQADQIGRLSLSAGLGSCYTPAETFPYKLDRSDPLYEDARKDHQRYLEEMEKYVNCLDQERNLALNELRASFNLFMENFGRDAVLQYGAERGVDLTE